MSPPVPIDTDFDQPCDEILTWLKDKGFRPVGAVEYPGSSGARSSRPIIERVWYRPGADHHPGFLVRVQGDGPDPSALERVFSLYSDAVSSMSYFKLDGLGGWCITASVSAGKVSTVIAFGGHEDWRSRIGHLVLGAFRFPWWLSYLADHPPKRPRGRPRTKRADAPERGVDAREADTVS